MAQKVLVQLVDDLDGSSTTSVETVSFALDGVSYEIDLSPKNAEKLRKNMAEFTGSARRIGGRIKRGTAAKQATASKGGKAKQPSAPANREQTKAVREWARQQGFELSDRGRIPANILEEFEAAHAKSGKKGKRKANSPAFSG